MTSGVEQRFQTLPEIVKAGRVSLNQNFWDYLMGGAESEPTVRRTPQAPAGCAFRPRVLPNTAEIDLSAKIFGKSLRIPVMAAPVGSLQSFEPGGGGTVAQAIEQFGAGLCLSSVTEPGLEAAAAQSPNALKIFQLYIRGDDAWVDDYVRRAVASGYD